MKKYIMAMLAIITGFLFIGDGWYGFNYSFDRSDPAYASCIGGAYFMVVIGIGIIAYVIFNPKEWDTL